MALAPLLIGVVLVAIVMGVSWRGLSGRRLRAWMVAREVPEREDTTELVRRELHRTRRYRGVAAALVLAYQAVITSIHAGTWPDVAPIVDWLVRETSGVTVVAAAYAIGAVLAEWRAIRPAQPGRAVVATRELGDYLAPGLRRTLIGLPLLTLLLVPLPAVVGVEPSWTGFVPSGAHVAGFAIAAAVVWALADGTARRVVARPQALQDAALIKADDALRSASIHGVVAAGVAIQLMGFSAVAWKIAAAADATAARWLLPAASLVAGVAAIVVWLAYAATSFPWAVRRPVAAPSPAPSVDGPARADGVLA